MKRSGRKAELIGRLLTNWQLEFDFTSVASEGNSDPCSGSTSKSLSSGKSLVDVHKIQSWTKSLASLADFTFMHLYHYLVNSKEKTFDEEGMKAYKSLKAYKYFADGYIRNVWAGEPQEQDDAVVVRCHCFSSLKAKKVYVVHLVKKSGDVLSAACTCVAGKDEACSHTAALIFDLEDFMRQGHSDLPTDTAATDHLQQWHVPPKRDVSAQPVEGITFRKAEYGKVLRTSFGHRYCPYPSDNKSNHDRAQAQQLISTVCAVLPSSGLTHFWDTAGQSSVVVPMSLSDTQNCIADVQSLVFYSATNPSLPPSVAQMSAIDVDSEDFREIICKQEEAQVITAKLSNFIESITRDQSACVLWSDLHNGRITSSNFGKVIHRRDSTDNASIIKHMMGYSHMSGLPVQMRWGLEKESVARNCYIKTMNSKGHGEFCVMSSGLTLLLSHSYLGASADGIIIDPQRPTEPGVLEIKCPVSVDGESVLALAPADIAAKYKGFYLHNHDGQVHLKPTSNYFYQVQGEMAIKSCKWAHFVVWTPANGGSIFWEEIPFNDQLWQCEMLPKLRQFFRDILLPEILLHKIQQTLQDVQVH